MNPPFTRASLRHDQFSASEERQLKTREAELIRSLEVPEDITRSGGANVFIAVANRMLDADSGTLALVVPTAMATNPSASGTRELLGREFHIDLIVASHDPCRICMSENTTISEMLVVCRRWTGQGDKPPTRVVNLAENPATTTRALQKLREIEESDEQSLTIQHIPASRIDTGNWNAVNFLSPFLNSEFEKLTSTDDPRWQRLGDIADLGGQGRSVPTAYARLKMPSTSGRVSLWDHKSEELVSMSATPSDPIEPKAGREAMANRYWRERSRLLLGERTRLNTVRLQAVWTKRPTIGSAWVTCRPRLEGNHVEQALCLFFNSTIGLLARLGGRPHRVLSYPTFSLEEMNLTVVPALDLLQKESENLSKVFRKIKDQPLRPFRYMSADSVRRRIDDAITSALQLDPEWVETIRIELEREPTITGSRYEQNPSLTEEGHQAPLP